MGRQSEAKAAEVSRSVTAAKIFLVGLRTYSCAGAIIE
jgi:hypothetical protein